MSQPNSLFAKIKISKEQFVAFLKAAPEQPAFDNDWSDWWNSRQMQSPKPLSESDLAIYNKKDNEAIINWLEGDLESMTFSQHGNGYWHFGVLMFGETYRDMLPAIAFLKSVASFKDDSSGDFATIYDYYWGGNAVPVYIEYHNGKGILKQKVKSKSAMPVENLKYANQFLLLKWNEFREKFGA
jgi:hypothetical protein